MSKDDIYANRSTEELKEVQKHLITLNHLTAWNPVYEALASEIKRRDKERPAKQYKKSSNTLNENVHELFEKPDAALKEAEKSQVKAITQRMQNAVDKVLERGPSIEEMQDKANDLASEGQVFHIISEAALTSKKAPIPQEVLEEEITKINMNDALGFGIDIDRLATTFSLNEEQKKGLTKAVLGAESSERGGSEIKVALYHHLLSSRDDNGHHTRSKEASEKISEVVADYCINHSQKSPKDLRDDIFIITSPVINQLQKGREQASQLLKDTSARIVDTFGDKTASIGFKERVGQIWRSFTKMLPTLLSSSKMVDKLHDYVAGPATKAYHHSARQQKKSESEQNR